MESPIALTTTLAVSVSSAPSAIRQRTCQTWPCSSYSIPATSVPKRMWRRRSRVSAKLWKYRSISSRLL